VLILARVVCGKMEMVGVINFRSLLCFEIPVLEKRAAMMEDLPTFVWPKSCQSKGNGERSLKARGK
jgi:hypothetical protein